MKVMRWAWTGLLLGCVCWTAAWAMDFSRMTNQELADLRGAIRNAPQEEQSAFQQEWGKRQAAMTEEEKKLFAKPLDEPDSDGKLRKPNIPGRGYETQGVGGVIYGGGEGIPGEVQQGAGK
ncbi:MAG: hypothetical protein ACYC9M_05620 [Desulfobulbaceae bacterium]